MTLPSTSSFASPVRDKAASFAKLRELRTARSAVSTKPGVSPIRRGPAPAVAEETSLSTHQYGPASPTVVVCPGAPEPILPPAARANAAAKLDAANAMGNEAIAEMVAGRG